MSRRTLTPPQRIAAPCPEPGRPGPPGACGPARRIDSAALFAGQVEIEIEHEAQVYRLRRTALGKLILTK